MNRVTCYVMEDGSFGDPGEISPDKDGKLVHKDGRAVAYAPHGPRTRSVDADALRKKPAPAKVEPVAEEAKEMKPEAPKRGYKTRESKGD